ncbi:MAG: hypothetical protein JWM32_3085 [Verrucomicrobia bacterium]|nr:hypothetical protein [Verrucomicrobiota bacterium]
MLLPAGTGRVATPTPIHLVMKYHACFSVGPSPFSGKRLFSAVIVISAFCFCAAPVKPATISIPLSATSPWDGAAHGVQPGDTLVFDGQTRAFFTFRNVQGSAAAPVTITNAGGAGGQFIYDNSSGPGGDSFYFIGCRYIIVKGTPSPGNYDYGIKIANTATGLYGMFFGANGLVGSSDFEVRDIEIGHAGFAGIGAQCKSLKGSSGFVMANVKIHGCYIHDTGGEGIYVGSSFFALTDTSSPEFDPHPIHGAEIYDNVIENSGYDGIQLGCATQNASIHDNVINGYGKNTSDTAQNEGIRSNPGTAADIYNNLIIGTAGSGDGIQANPYNDVKYYNNVISTPHESGLTVYEQAATWSYVNGYSIKIMNNTIVSPTTHGIVVSAGHSSGNLAYNNLVTHPGSGSYMVKGSTTVTESNELYVTTDAGAGFVNSVTLDYHLAAGSAARNAGTSVSSYGITTDYDGTNRVLETATDAGAFEYIPIGILSVTGFGQAGTAYCPATGALNEPPTWDATNHVPTGVSASPYTATGTGYASRCWYVDFGPNYAKVRITGTWTRYMPFTTGSNPGFGAMWWDDDNDSTNDNGVTATGLNFGTAQGLNTGSAQPWVQDSNNSSAPVAPQRRYLLINTGSAPATRANEFVFVGYMLP